MCSLMKPFNSNDLSDVKNFLKILISIREHSKYYSIKIPN